jgi:hypothetical protein
MLFVSARRARCRRWSGAPQGPNRSGAPPGPNRSGAPPSPDGSSAPPSQGRPPGAVVSPSPPYRPVRRRQWRRPKPPLAPDDRFDARPGDNRPGDVVGGDSHARADGYLDRRERPVPAVARRDAVRDRIRRVEGADPDRTSAVASTSRSQSTDRRQCSATDAFDVGDPGADRPARPAERPAIGAFTQRAHIGRPRSIGPTDTALGGGVISRRVLERRGPNT